MELWCSIEIMIVYVWLFYFGYFALFFISLSSAYSIYPILASLLERGSCWAPVVHCLISYVLLW